MPIKGKKKSQTKANLIKLLGSIIKQLNIE